MPSTTVSNAGIPRVYIVDDDAAVRTAISMLVNTCGWESIACASADDFFACYIPGGKQCLILDLDLQIPGKGGIDVQSELQQRADPLPIVVVTAHSEYPEARLARSRGARAVFDKPFDSDKLLECLRQTLTNESEKTLEENG